MQIEKLCRVKSVLLLVGETGVGKTLLARQIHKMSDRSHLPFVDINMGAIPDQLFQSELFGHKRGSFTGASVDKNGFCDEVNGGTLFLDEIGELSLVDQSKLLTFLDSREYYPVGSRLKKQMRGTVILATNRNLEKMVEEGDFRSDLFYRITQFRHEIPPIRSIKNFHLELLKCIQDFPLRHSIPPFHFTPKAYHAITHYHWPGNWREVTNVLHYLSVMHEATPIDLSMLPFYKQKGVPNINLGDESFHSAVEGFEKSFLECKLRDNLGKVNQTALRIGISKVTLIAKMRKYQLCAQQIRSETRQNVI